MQTETNFSGLYYAGREKTSVRFSVSRHGLIEFAVGEQGRKDIALQRTTLDLIGDPNITLQIRWTESNTHHALLCQDPILFEVLLAINLPQAAREHIQSLQTKQQHGLRGEKHRVPLYLGLIAAFLIGGYFSLHYSVPLVAEFIPYEWEQKIGAFAFENYQLGKKTVTDKTVNDAVNSIVKRIDQFDNADIDYQVAVVDADMINAFAFPGGYVVVTTGLIDNADNPEQVAGVLAHELTHVIQRHSLRKLVRQAGMGVLNGIVFGDVSALSQLIELSSQLDSLSFDRDQERSADDGAIKIMTAAGISPKHLAAFFEKIQKADSISGDIPELFQTHPLTDERINRVAAEIDTEQSIQFDMDWADVKHRLKQRVVSPSP